MANIPLGKIPDNADLSGRSARATERHGDNQVLKIHICSYINICYLNDSSLPAM
jgi:hypothetical protein